MAEKAHSRIVIVLLLGLLSAGCQKGAPSEQAKVRKSIVTSDTILSGMSESLLPSDHFEVAAILPPGQCPGHYDVKLTDIVKVKKANLVVSFRGMPFMDHAEVDAGKQLLIDAKDHNWMAPHSYVAGLSILASQFMGRFPEYESQISARRDRTIQEATEKANALADRIGRAGVSRMPVIASSMLKEPLEWMGFLVVGEYGRPESLSAKEIAALIRVGREKRVAMIVDNLQLGPEAGKGIAEALGVPHVIFSNFPSEQGYAATLSENVEVALSAAKSK